MEIMSMSAAGAGGSVFGGGGSVFGGGSAYGDYDPATVSDRDAAPSQPTATVPQRHLHHSTGNLHHHQSISSCSLPPLKTPRNIPPMSPRIVAFKQQSPQVSEKDDVDDDDPDDQDDQYNSDDRGRHATHSHHSATVDLLPTSFRRGSSYRDVNDVDNKSHMSELTEDRTQRVLEGAWASSPRQYHSHHRHPSPHHAAMNQSTPPPPAYVEKKGQSNSKLSVAQRSRLEADRQTTPVRVRLDSIIAATDNSTPPANKREESSTASKNGGGVWQRMEDAVLGPADPVTHGRRKARGENRRRRSSGRSDESESISPDGDDGSDDEDDDSASGSSSGTASNSEEEKKKDSASNTPDASSKSVGIPNTANLTLAQRSQLQRAMQLQFLKEQGLIANENDVKGGASLSGNTPSPAFQRLGSGSSSQRKKGPIRLNSGMSDTSSHCTSSVGR
jgi:hypothetical protein